MSKQKYLKDLKGRSLLKDTDLSKEEFLALVDLAGILRQEKWTDTEKKQLEVGAHDQGAHVTYMGPDETQLGHKESVKDTARVLGRMFDGIEFRGFAHADVEKLAEFAGVPVWNGLTDEWHPTQLLADVMTILDHSTKPIEQVALCYVGDARNNTANSILVVGALLGMDIRIGAPGALQPSAEVQGIARQLAEHSKARITITESPSEAVDGADFVYTDVWLSMGEPKAAWGERIEQLLPYQVNAGLLASSGNPDVKFLHCLPALHNTETEVGAELAATYGVSALEVTTEVFESSASIVFDQAENRVHTIKALMVATLGS